MAHRPRPSFILALLAPAVLMYCAFVVIPALNAFRYSLTNWDGLSEARWVGLKNYATIARRGADFATALGHNIYLTVLPGAIILALALFFAYSLHRGVAGGRIFRVAFFFPNVIAFVAIALLWVLIYSTTEVGLINHFLRLFFHYKTPIPFTQSSRLLTALPPVIVWSATGFYMVLFLAGMENIPETYYEAARMDGAGDARMFFTITVPLLWDVLATGIVYLIIGGLKIFDVIWVMENGRPGKATHTLATLMYSKVFEEYEIGYGTAIAVLLFCLVLLVSLVSLRLLRRERLEY
ncbi:MAG: carbohydrate ABC transporter permease [Chthonomonadales bacterium]